MKSLVGRARFQLELRDEPRRPVSGRMVRVRVRTCGVCGTDLHFLRENPDWTPLGHEIAAEVVEIGAEVARVRPGDRVIVEDVTMCGACTMCKTGRYDLCRNPYRLDGQSGMAEEMVVHENMLNPFEGIDWVPASMVEPLAVAITCVDKLKLPPLGSLLVYGMGAIGLFCAAYAKKTGAARVDLAARDPKSLRNRRASSVARALGADQIFFTKDPAWASHDEKYDAAIVAASPSLTADALRRVQYGGAVLACGISLGGGATADIDVSDMVMNKKSLITSLAEPAVNFPLSIALIARGDIDAGRIVTHALPLAGAAKLREFYDADSDAIKTVIQCS